MKQTAVEWLVQEANLLENNGWILPLIEQAKEMEKENTINFARHCLDKAKDLDILTAFMNVEQYYNQTFKSE
jgi:ATP sulfurylase